MKTCLREFHKKIIHFFYEKKNLFYDYNTCIAKLPTLCQDVE